MNDFDAIFFYGIGELELTDWQKADVLSFIREDGKGFVASHTAVTAFYTWPEYTDLICVSAGLCLLDRPGSWTIEQAEPR